MVHENTPYLEGEDGRKASLHQWRAVVTVGAGETSLLSPETWGPETPRATGMSLPAQDSGGGVVANSCTHLEDACPAPLAQAPAGPYLMFDLGFNAGRKPMGWQRLLTETPPATSLAPLP